MDLRKHRALVLAGLGIVFGGFGVALLLATRDVPVVPEGGIQEVVISAAVVPDQIVVALTPDGKYRVQVGIILNAVQGRGKVEVAFLIRHEDLPPGALCPSGASCNTSFTGTVVQYGGATGWTDDGSYGNWQFTRTVSVPDLGWGVAENAEYVSVTHPDVYDYLTTGSKPVAESGISTIYHAYVPNGDAYTWDSGAASVTPIYLGLGTEEWTSPTAAAGPVNSTAEGPLYPLEFVAASPITDSGVNLSVQNWHNYEIFLAGVALGIAGGAVVGAVQERLDKE